ncbi:MAG: 5-formyltetrahydrofolate cyclo-ligase [Phycisphaeraceae bacterium]|nr:5-formyltetrahydrofolate cyclo-ligase [Phycisphaeraceae bacterium]
MNKSDLRKHYRAIRGEIPDAQLVERSAAIEQFVLSIDRIEQAGSVFVYVSSGSEARTHELIAALLSQGKAVAVPRVLPEPGVMQPVLIHALDDFAPGRFGIPEPTAHEPFEQTPDVTIVPGLAFTRLGERLGQGGGYYDRYLQQHPATYKIGLSFNEQLADTLPTSEHDIAMDEVVTA